MFALRRQPPHKMSESGGGGAAGRFDAAKGARARGRPTRAAQARGPSEQKCTEVRVETNTQTEEGAPGLASRLLRAHGKLQDDADALPQSTKR